MSSGVVRARGGRHQVDIYLQGERYRKAVGSKREATRFLEQMRAGGRHPQRKLAVEEVLALYEQTLRVRAKWNTIGQLEVHARHLLHHFGEGFLATAIAPQDIEKFASARKAEGRSHSTVNGSLRILRAALRNAVEQRELAEMPCRIKLLRETKKLPMILNAEEVEQLLAVAPAPIDLAILIAAKAGLRHQEIRFLQVRDADLARSILLVRAKHGWTPKDHEERSIPIAGRLRERLQHQVANRRSTEWLIPGYGGEERKNLMGPVRKVFEEAGLYDRSRKTGLHMLRRTWASSLLAAGVDLETVRELAGWSDLEVAQRYLASTNDLKRHAIARLG